jgi:UDP-glucuronate decarboxylase
MKTILVTGGAGFIGSHLCKRLLDEGNFVICVDNLFSSTGDNIKPFLDNHNFKFLQLDVINPMIFYNKIDEIFHLACPASPIWYQKDPVFTTKTCVIGSINALELARKNNCKILLSSTSEIYGDPLVHPQVESYWGNVNPIGLRACYDESRRCAETLFFDYHRQYSVDIKVNRFFNTYGPNMARDDGRVVSNFITQAIENKDITMYGDGSQTRSFQYIDDLINGVILMMKSENCTGPINLGNPHEFTMLELAQMVIKLTNSTSQIVFKPLPQDDPRQRRPDISLAKEKLGWEPIIQLEEGLKKTVEYFKNLN